MSKEKDAGVSIDPGVEESARQRAIIRELRDEFTQKGWNKRYWITTLGCQMNARDSEKLSGILEEIGYRRSEVEESADLVIYNTCCVRENAEQKVYGRLGYLKNYKKRRPEMKIALCGCMMQENLVLEKLKKSYPQVDLIFGTHNLYKFPELLQAMLSSGERIIDIWKEHGEIVEDLPSNRKYSFKASVNVMFGCNNFCTYCIVPYVRGRERSRRPEEILKEISQLAQDGVKEVQLLGQNVNSYGKTLEHPITFAQLLQEISQIDGIERIRFMTSHPKDLSQDLIDAMATLPKVCPHFHLPLQSGSSRILEKMNRHYDQARYLDVVRRLREAVPDISLTTDIIVGFPGETDDDFEETVKVVRDVQFDSAFTFLYSKREGTPAAAMAEQVPEEEAKRHFDRLLDVLKEDIHAKNETWVGRTVLVLAEETSKHDEGMLTGRTPHNQLVHFQGDRALIGSVVPVKIVENQTFYFTGERIPSE